MNVAVTRTVPAGESLRIERLIAAPVERVFDYWTKAELVARWLAPGEMSVADNSSDLEEGGPWHVTMRRPDGTTVRAEGHYLVIDPPHHLVFSWGSKDTDCAAGVSPTEVDIALTAVPGGTRLVLTHTKFATVDQRDRHNTGWGMCLDKLEGVARAG